MELSVLVKNQFEYIKSVRRRLHAMAELSGKEVRTQEFILRELKSMGIKGRAVEGGVIAEVDSSDRVNRIGFRADMDALPITEANDIDFKADGAVMHACGHDGHMAMLLGLAKIISCRAPDYSVRLIFQPSEESEGGASRMIAAGAADGLTEIYALHLSPEYPVGTIATDSGAIFAGVVEFDVTFTGVSAHAASREQGRDAVMAAVSFLEGARETDKKYCSNNLLHCGRIEGGTARNIVADCCTVYMTLRYFDGDKREEIMAEVSRLLERIGRETGTAYRIKICAAYPPLINNKEITDIVESTVSAVKAAPKYTAEDFAEFCIAAPAAMSWLGIRDDRHQSPLHSATFGFDEQALLYGLELYKRLIYKEDK